MDKTAADLLASRLEQAHLALAHFHEHWATDQSQVLLSTPIWQEAINLVSPEWARVMGQSVGWLDQIPKVLLEASSGLADKEMASGYARVGQDLEDLLKKVANPNVAPWPKKKSPSEQLAEISQAKDKLSQESKKRIQAMRAALDLGDRVRELAAISAEVIPFFRAELDERLAAMAASPAQSLFESQKQARDAKAIQRAQGSLDTASQRLASEFQEGASYNRDQLERMTQEEENQLVRLDQLTATVARQIANVAMGNQANEKISAIKGQSLANSNDSTQGTERGAFVSSKMSSEAQKSIALLWNAKPRASVIAHFWGNVASALQDPSVNALSEVKGLKKNLVNFIAEEYRPSGALDAPEILCALLDRAIPDFNKFDPNAPIAHNENSGWLGFNNKKQPIYLDAINWEALARTAVHYCGSIEAMHPHPGSGWSLLARVAKVRPDLVEHIGGSELVNMASHALDQHRSQFNQDQLDDLRWVIKSFATPEDMAAGMGSVPPSIWPHESKYLGPKFQSKVALHVLTSNAGSSAKIPSIQSLLQNQVSLLLEGDLRAFVERLLNGGSPLEYANLPKDLLRRPDVARDLRTQRIYKDTEWVHLLKDLMDLEKDSVSTLPVPLFNRALDSGNTALLDYMAASRPQAVLEDPPPMALARLVDLSSSAKRSLRTVKLNEAYWCRALAHRVNDVIDQPLHDKQPSSALGLACAQGGSSLSWVAPLLGNGAFVNGKSHLGKTPTELMREHIQEREMGSAFHEASWKKQEAFIRELANAMEITGLWDIKQASPLDPVQARLLCAAIQKDQASTTNAGKDAVRRVAIDAAMWKMSTAEFGALLPYAGVDKDQMAARTSIKAMVSYGTKQGLIEGSDAALKIEEAVAKALELSSRPRTEEPQVERAAPRPRWSSGITTEEC